MSDKSRGDEERKAAIARLAKHRHEDTREMFQEEQKGFRPSKRALQQDDDEDEFRDDSESTSQQPPAKRPMTVAEKLMAKMGHKEGEGLGKQAHGITKPVALSSQRGRTGLGNAAGKATARDFNEVWNDEDEVKTVEETVRWMTDIDESKRKEICDQLVDDRWMVVRKEKKVIDDEIDFCSEKTLKEMIEAKNVFDMMSDKDLREARTRANPYETIGSAFFQNRAAMKTANMDKIYDWILSRENTENEKFLQKNPIDGSTAENIDRTEELFYFADVCAGPGGFSEYMLWRKGFYNAKGFGFTLAGKDDFKLQKFTASSAYFFETFYGTKQNGDVMDPENIDSLEDFISRGTEGHGVHLMMADGGFSVEGQENIQEILSKRLYLCQLLVSLCIVREGGNFFCKLFDIFTPFSVGLIYLMRVCYDSVSLHKPHTSRPANSERYITCKGLRKEFSDVVKDYLKRVNRKMDKFKKDKSTDDIMELMPLDLIKSDEIFMKEIIEHNEYLAIRQTIYLRKYQSFAKNQGQFDKDQGSLRDQCLKYWQVPNRQRPKGGDRGNRNGNMERLSPLQVYGKYCQKICSEHEFGNVFPDFHIRMIRSPLPSNIPYEEYRFTPLAANQRPNLLISTGDSVFIFKNGYFEQQTRNYIRIPENTILLIDFAQETAKTDQNKIKISTEPEVIRILDAAVLYGDNISHFPYETRMKCAQKFVKALKLTNRTVRQGWGNRAQDILPHLITCSPTFSLRNLDSFRSGLDQHLTRGEAIVLFKSGGFSFNVRGLRFTRIIKQDWQMGWSKSNQKPYLHSPFHTQKGSLFEDKWAENNIYSSFWDSVILSTKDKQKLTEMMNQGKSAVPSTTWSWKASLSDSYGPEKILNFPEEFNEKPTVASVLAQIEATDASAQRRNSH
uniref:Cap-specific mRNA (nucleoside-2'-O-)-methyltransferase 1 n=1 Tax=Caenorhabditis tropicalis TaxID=1561998 RepID=A0A1I7TCI5_9PELO